MKIVPALVAGILCTCAIAAPAVDSPAGPLGLAYAPAATKETRLTITWYGVATLLFDDGDTQFLIDGFFSRPSQTDAQIAPEIDQIKRQIDHIGLHELAAITPVHSHFDHAMDLGVIARLTGASVLGSASTANIARGAGVPEDQIKTLAGDAGRYRFGEFEIVLIRSKHAPLVDGGPPIPGTIDAPLVPPAALIDWREGGSYTVVVRHPAGTTVVQGSAGYVAGALDQVEADVVLLGIGGLTQLGEGHAAQYWAEIVDAVAPQCVLPIHWDDFWQPYGTIVASDRAKDSLAWFDTGEERPMLLEPRHGEGMDLFTTRCN